MKRGKQNNGPKEKDKYVQKVQVDIPDRTKPDFQPGTGSKGRYDSWIHLGILLIIFLVAYISSFSDKINLGGDNICYFTLGKALASGYGYVDIISPGLVPNNHFPPGYPFIISLFMRIGFDEIGFFYGLNGLFTFLSIAILYKLLIRLDFSNRFAFVVCFFVTINTGIISFAITNMSEIPYLLFSLLALYLFAGLDFKKSVYLDFRFLLIMVMVVSAYYIRTSAITLILAMAIVLLVKKKWVHLLSFLTIFFLAILPWHLRSNALGGNSYVKQLLSKNPYAPELGKAGMNDFLDRMSKNLSRYISTEIPSSITGQFFENVTNPTIKDWVIGIAILLLVFYAIVKLAKSVKILPILLYMVFTAGMLSLWPEKWTGIRFMLPIVPLLLFLILYSINSLFEILGHQLKVNWNSYVLCVAGIFLLAPLRLLGRMGEVPYPQAYQNYFDIAEWAKINTPENSIICCRKPELFYLFSERKCVNYPYSLNADSVFHFLEHAQVDFVVVEQLGYSSTGKYLLPAINKNSSRFKILRKQTNPETYFLKLSKPGITGSLVPAANKNQ